jgi:hypothetical protein
MNSIDVRSKRDIQPVVNENSCWGSGSSISNLTYEFVQGSSFEIFSRTWIISTAFRIAAFTWDKRSP